VDGAGKGALHIIRRLREELKVNTTGGASNISFGLPNRHGLNGAFLAMAIGAGMTSAILNPLHGEEMMAIKGADVMMGVDPHCQAWMARYRDPAARREGRRGGRRGRRAGQDPS
jgi:5-methyltetrahydrofolate--homocysteine methyltransferase